MLTFLNGVQKKTIVSCAHIIQRERCLKTLVDVIICDKNFSNVTKLCHKAVEKRGEDVYYLIVPRTGVIHMGNIEGFLNTGKVDHDVQGHVQGKGVRIMREGRIYMCVDSVQDERKWYVCKGSLDLKEERGWCFLHGC